MPAASGLRGDALLGSAIPDQVSRHSSGGDKLTAKE